MNMSPYRKQGGAILVMFTIGLFSLIAVAALALDGGHLLLNKGRLQNAVDAAALNAAKELQDGASLYEAREAATTLLLQNLQYQENGELNSSIDLSAPDFNSTQVAPNLFIEFSEWPDPFSPILVEGSEYVRVRVENVGLTNFLAQIMNFDKAVRASAVAGRSTDIECLNKAVPMMVCAINEDKEDNFGFSPGAIHVMKIGSNTDSPIGPGNFQLLRMDGSSGGADIRRALAGEFTLGMCVEEGDNIPTEPGNTVGPVVQGLNTRFGTDTGGGNLDEYLRDFDTCQGERIQVDDEGNILVQLDEFGNPVLDVNGHTIPVDNSGNVLSYYTHAEYSPASPALPPSSCPAGFSGDILPDTSTVATSGRREFPIVIGVCDGNTNGANTIQALGTGCFFMTQDVSQQGSEAHVIGEFVSVCSGSGSASLDPTFTSKVSTVVLYRDPDSPDS
uniref:Tad domain-containing protein n=1 Tax=Shewanella atlantica TaxID=271099 RepID=UPI0037357A59